MKRSTTFLVCALLAAAGVAQAQFNNTGTTTLSVAVGQEAALSVTTGTTTLANAGTIFNAFTGTTSLSYKIRTTKVGGTGTITSKVTTDFGPAGGPSVATPPTAGDALTYTCTVSSPGTACTGTQTASTAATTAFASFGAGANSSSAGNTASAAWSMTDDPAYATGTYTATVTFTISST